MSFRIRKKQVFLNQLEVSFKMKKTSLSDNEILSINQDQNLRKTGKVFQGIMSFRKTSSLSEFINLITKIIGKHIYISITKIWMRTTSATFVFPFLSSVKKNPVFLEQVLDPKSLSSKPGIRFAQEH